jgi:hypothetical protein
MTFLNAGYAPWLLVAGLPILIHLLTRQAARVYSLPTFRLLQRSVAQQSKLFKVRHLLLLLLRVAVVTLLVLVFLKPAKNAALGSPGEGNRTVLLVLDDSLSMAYRGGGVPSLQKAQNQALKVLDSLRPGDRASVILAGAAPVAVLPSPTTDLGTLRQAVKTVAATQERCDVPAAVALAVEQLGKGGGSRELTLISDFQRSNWADVKLEGLPPGARVVFIGTEEGDRDNFAVTGIKLRPSVPRAGDDITALVSVWNGSRGPRPVPVTFQSPGRPPQTQVVNIPPSATGTAAFAVSFPEPGRYSCTASLKADSLPDDDTRWLVADLQHAMTVYLLTDENAVASPAGAYFLSRALNPNPAEPGGIRVIPKRATELSDADLKAAGALILSHVTTMPADKLPAIHRYVQQGGALLVFVYGDRIIPQMEALNRLAGNGEGLPFLPTAPMDVSKKGKGYVNLSEARYESRLLRFFKDPSAADLGKIKFSRFFLTSEPDSHAEVLLKYEDGTPAAARRSLGTGNILLCNFSPSPADSDLVRQEVFPPLLHELLKGLASKEADKREFVPGGSASTTITPTKGKVTASGPDGREASVTVDRTGGAVVLDRTEKAGLYSIVADGKEVAVLPVNVHPDESDLRTIDPRELQATQDRRPTYLVGSQGERSEIEGLYKDRPIWPYLLVAAFLTLALEQWVAGVGTRRALRTR